jgi:hypothetical protein
MSLIRRCVSGKAERHVVAFTDGERLGSYRLKWTRRPSPFHRLFQIAHQTVGDFSLTAALRCVEE